MSDTRLPRTFWILFVGTLINRMGAIVVPLFAIFLTEMRGYSPTFAGFVCSLYGLGSFCSGLVGGQLADRIGRRRTLLLGLVWGATALTLVLFAHAPLALALASLQLGLAGDIYRPAVMAAVADLCTPTQRPRAYGLLYWAANVGFAVATAVGGSLARHGFATLFVIDAATTLAYAGVVALFVPETQVEVHREASEGNWGTVVRDRELVAVVMVGVLVGLLFQQSQAALPVALLARGITPARYGLILGLNGVLVVFLQPPLAGFIEKLRRTRALAAASLLVGVGFAWNALPFGLAGAVTSVVFWSLGEILLAPVSPALVSDLAPSHLRGRYQGVNQMAYGICAFCGPFGGMAILQHAGERVLWLTCLMLGVLAALLYLALAPALRQRIDGRGAPA